MGTLEEKQSDILNIVLYQLQSYWTDIDKELIKEALPDAIEAIEKGFWGLPNKRFFDGDRVIFSPYMSVQWMIFLYRLSHAVYIKSNGKAKEADQIYYLNKIMHSNDWFYGIELPEHFLCEHPLGSVLGRAHYGDYLFIYQGTTVGGNRSNGILCYPTIGDNVILFANATVLGNTKIGNNVVVSANTYLLDETIPDNSIVFGKSPDIIIKGKSEEKIKDYTRHIWGWR